MKRLTILDENFIATEMTATTKIQEATSIMNKVMMPVMDIAINESEEIRFAPAFLETKANVNPVASINNIVNKICESISAKKTVYDFNSVAVLSEIYNKLSNTNTVKMSAIEESTTIFGIGNISFNLSENKIEVNDMGLLEARRKLNTLREMAVTNLSKLDSAARNNNLAETVQSLQQLVLLKEFVNYL